MNNTKNKNRTYILAIILLGLLIFAYKTIFMSTDSNIASDENLLAVTRAEKVLKEMDKINFDTSVMEDESFKSLNSIAIPLPSLPVGRTNPFSGIFSPN